MPEMRDVYFGDGVTRQVTFRRIKLAYTGPFHDGQIVDADNGDELSARYIYESDARRELYALAERFNWEVTKCQT